MISETFYASYHAAAWSALMPGSELFVRRINFDLYRRAFPAMESDVAANRRAVVNETAFNYFASKTTGKNIGEAFDKARALIYRLEAEDVGEISELSNMEVEDVKEQCRRLETFIGHSTCQIRPQFAGCGVINRCEGDILKDKCLYEIKAGDRPIRSIDLRQLVIYLALNRSSGKHDIDTVCLFNPRRGTFFGQRVDRFCLNTSGKTFVELTDDVIEAISGGSLSN